MTISTEIARLKTSIANAYDALEAKGAVIPAIENPDNLVYAIDTISVGGGDEITATNTTGSAVSADDRVWVEPVTGEEENFTKVGTVAITDKVAQSLDTNNYISFPNVNFGNNTWEYQTAIYFTTITSGSKTVLSNPFQINVQFTGDSIFLFLSSNGTSWDINSTSYTDFQIPNQTKYYIKVVFDGSKYLLQTSADGSSWTTRITVNNSTKIFNSLEDIAIGKSSNVIDYLYLEDTYIKVDGNIVWTPYKEAVVGYSIINDTDITSTSFTGIAQEAIANNATGSVKTLLDGNGSYAPITATKSITTNGTYTASAENAYGLSEVTVNVPTINNTTVVITPTRRPQTFTPESPYTGYSLVRVLGVTRTIDENIQSNNIKEGVSILGVTGTLTPTPIKEWHNWKNFSWSSTTKRLSNSQKYGKAIAYGDGNFVTVSSGSKAEYSTDGGVTWYETNMPSSADWSCIAYGDGVFVAVAGTFSSQTGSNKAAYSTDGGITWNSTTMPNTRQWNAIAYGDGKFIAVAYNSNKAAYSSDGITWTEIDIPQNNWTSIAYGNGTFVAISHLSYNATYSTDGGATWHTSRLSFDATWRCITYGNGVFVAVDSDSGLINYSTDGGATWTKSNWKNVKWFYSVVYGDGQFIAISKKESTQYAVAISSTDGNTWTAISGFPSTSIMASIAYGNGRFVCTGSTNTVEIGSQSECYTLEATPTTSSTVYSAPNTASTLTITSVGAGTITLSDSKVYNRNSAGDEESVMNITQNGTYDVTQYVSAVVDVPSSSGVGITREVSAQGVYQMPANSFTFSLPSNATDVGTNALANAFTDCTSLTSVDLSALTEVSGDTALENAFLRCKSLTSVNLSSLTTVSGDSALYYAFGDCTALTSIDLSSLTTVSGDSGLNNAFFRCTGLTSIDLSALTTISGDSALSYAFRGCTRLTDIYFRALTTTSFGSYENQFRNMMANTETTTTHTLHFPSNLQSTISGLSGYPNFGGTSGYVTCLFDLPATGDVIIDIGSGGDFGGGGSGFGGR